MERRPPGPARSAPPLGTCAGRHPGPDGAAAEFRAVTGAAPEGVWQSPGRVTLIGDHTDYNGGLALPFAIDRRTTVAVRRRPDRRWRTWSAQRPGVPGDADLAALEPGRGPQWSRYVFGVAWAAQQAGLEVPGLDLVVDSTVPFGAGLASSAALIVAVAVAVDELTGAGLDREQLAGLAHDAEAGFVGAPTGTLDQRAVLLATAGHGLLVDFRSLTAEPVPLGAAEPLVVVDTGVRHEHATGGYGRRRRECAEAAAALGLPDLRAAEPERLTGVLAARARHVVTEDARVLAAADRLRSGSGVGDLLSASHRSLRDDFEVSCPELDAVVDAVLARGAGGARLTGGGFGGSVIVSGLPADEVEAAVGPAVASVFAVSPSGPAGRWQ